MPRGIPSKGKCAFCQKEFSKSALTLHLNTHLNEKIESGKPGKSYHIKIETNPRWGSTPYFLHLWIGGNCTLDDIDYFLRLIWLECCGHMSAFRFPLLKRGGIMNFIQGMAEGNMKLDEYGDIPMNKKSKNIFRKDLTLDYQYDFGSTTELKLIVLEEYNIGADRPIVLLSRNERPEWKCQVCGKETGTKICTVCMDENMFCPTCAKKHAKKCPDFADYAVMSVVNSPRMGVCGYEGGKIDKERD